MNQEATGNTIFCCLKYTKHNSKTFFFYLSLYSENKDVNTHE